MHRTYLGGLGIAAALTGATDSKVDDIVASMLSFTADIFLTGHGRDREREADMFVSFYLADIGVGDRPLVNAFKKLKFARDAYDPV